MLRIFADENISAVEDILGEFGRVTTVSGREITRESLQNADVLLVRSVTMVDTDLLDGTPVKFVGTATAGTDHLDVEGLRDSGIAVSHAPGSNAPSVCDYVVAALLHLVTQERRRLQDLTCAVIGCGAVGGALARRLEHLGLRVVRSDPPLHDEIVARDSPSPYVDADTAIRGADVITLHVPLHEGPYSTYGLIDERRLRLAKETAYLINTSRGLVVNETDLTGWLAQNNLARAVVDVWTDEPNVSCDLLKRTRIATAHIAGYAVEGKLRATLMLRDAIAAWIREETTETPIRLEPIDLDFDQPSLTPEMWMDDLVKAMYDIRTDHEALKPICDVEPNLRAQFFDGIRRGYPTRHEFSRYRISGSVVPPQLRNAVRYGLGIMIG